MSLVIATLLQETTTLSCYIFEKEQVFKEPLLIISLLIQQIKLIYLLKSTTADPSQKLVV